VPLQNFSGQTEFSDLVGRFFEPEPTKKLCNDTGTANISTTLGTHNFMHFMKSALQEIYAISGMSRTY